MVLQEAQAYADQGDSTTLANAQSYTSQREESIRTDFATADQYVLSQAKEYADTVKDWNDEDNRKRSGPALKTNMTLFLPKTQTPST